MATPECPDFTFSNPLPIDTVPVPIAPQAEKKKRNNGGG
jgi:hypothetical protein